MKLKGGPELSTPPFLIFEINFFLDVLEVVNSFFNLILGCIPLKCTIRKVYSAFIFFCVSVYEMREVRADRNKYQIREIFSL